MSKFSGVLNFFPYFWSFIFQCICYLFIFLNYFPVEFSFDTVGDIIIVSDITLSLERSFTWTPSGDLWNIYLC